MRARWPSASGTSASAHQVEPLRLLAQPGEGLQLAHDVPHSLRSRPRLGEGVGGLAKVRAPRDLVLCESQGREHAGKRVVDLVGHAGRQRPDGGEALRLVEALADPPSLGDIGDVAMHPHVSHQSARLVSELGDVHLGVEPAAVPAPPPGHGGHPRLVAYPLGEVLDVPAVRHLGDEDLAHVAADGLGGGVAVHALGGAVPGADDEVRPDAHHRVVQLRQRLEVEGSLHPPAARLPPAGEGDGRARDTGQRGTEGGNEPAQLCVRQIVQLAGQKGARGRHRQQRKEIDEHAAGNRARLAGRPAALRRSVHAMSSRKDRTGQNRSQPGGNPWAAIRSSATPVQRGL